MKRLYSENEADTLDQTEKFNSSQNINDLEHFNI